MKVGILGEKADDIAFYTPLVIRLLQEQNIILTEEDIITDITGTHILKYIEEKTIYFFSEPIVDIAFYFSDLDDGVCAKTIITWFRAESESGRAYPIVLCFPNPHIEGWFCLEQDAVKKVFGINSGKALVCQPKPKRSIFLLIKENDDLTKISQDFYKEIGQKINFDKLSRDQAFGNLRNEVRRVVNQYELNVSPDLFDQ